MQEENSDKHYNIIYMTLICSDNMSWICKYTLLMLILSSSV